MNDPVIEASTNLRFAPFNVAYHGLAEQAASAGLDPECNKWELVFDFSANKDTHYEIMDPADFKTIQKVVPGQEGAPEPQIVFGLPRRYGGTLTDEKPRSSAENEGLMSFDIKTTGQNAAKNTKDQSESAASSAPPVTTSLPTEAVTLIP